MRILVCNDDGYQSQGITALSQALAEIAEVTVVAPDRNRSGASNSLTLDRPLTVTPFKERGFYVSGTPTDCVHLTLSGLFEDEPVPDMVVSGINHGSNLGDDVLYSGTVAAAIQGRFLGLPAIAISLHEPAVHFETAAHVIKNLVLRLKSKALPTSTILNVNVPDVALDQLRGYEITRLGTRFCSEKVTRHIDPRGKEVYWIGLPGPVQDSGSGTDFYAIQANKVSITPLSLDWTNYVLFDEIAGWIKGLTA
ncbi:MAG: 5'/3'-nucleotidase SurE [Gammaproteobacteria bacterium RIFCSPHIGHO2_12_FULL_35_23]|nr:MAG: 5'/3'-nucleotidase SurE [Gammaproteobacteria bacterium RIFCSPHIGHO2_12_FULL_35_23]